MRASKQVAPDPSQKRSLSHLKTREAETWRMRGGGGGREVGRGWSARLPACLPPRLASSSRMLSRPPARAAVTRSTSAPVMQSVEWLLPPEEPERGTP